MFWTTSSSVSSSRTFTSGRCITYARGSSAVSSSGPCRSLGWRTTLQTRLRDRTAVQILHSDVQTHWMTSWIETMIRTAMMRAT